mgnify:FL=1
MALAVLIGYGYQVMQYVIQDADQPVTIPIIVRVVVAYFYLTGGSVFVGLTQQANYGFDKTILMWGTLVTIIVFLVAIAGILT